MSYFLFIIKSSIVDLKINKARTLLTSLGILIGVFSVVMLISLGLGLTKYIDNQFKSLGANLVFVMQGKILKGSAGVGSGIFGGAKFDEKDVANLKKIKNLELVTPLFTKYAPIEGKEKNYTYEIIAATENIFKLMNYEIDKGQLFTKSDNEKRDKIAVLGSGAAEKIFGKNEEAVGKTITILELRFKVAGVLKPKGGGSLGGAGLDDRIFIPYKSAQSLNPDKKFFAIYMKTQDETLIEETKKEIENLLNKRYEKDDFTVSDQKELLNTFNSIFSMLNIVLVGLAAISLIVGGVGVMNIMFVSVTERIMEIGIRRAVGAYKKDIIFLFLGEAILLCLTGGILGIILASIAVLFIQPFFPAYINLSAVLLAITVSTAIGIIFGVFPAKQAAQLSPIEAIKYEPE